MLNRLLNMSTKWLDPNLSVATFNKASVLPKQAIKDGYPRPSPNRNQSQDPFRMQLADITKSDHLKVNKFSVGSDTKKQTTDLSVEHLNQHID